MYVYGTVSVVRVGANSPYIDDIGMLKSQFTHSRIPYNVDNGPALALGKKELVCLCISVCLNLKVLLFGV